MSNNLNGKSHDLGQVNRDVETGTGEEKGCKLKETDDGE